MIPGLATKLVQNKQGTVYLELRVLEIDTEYTITLYLSESDMHALSEACLNGINAASGQRIPREQKRQQWARRKNA